MNIDGMGPAVVRQLLDNELIHTIVDIYHVPDRREDLTGLEKMGRRICG